MRRHAVKTPLRVRVWKSNGPEQSGESLNLSEYGVYFATNSIFREGETVEVLLSMPEEIIGEETGEWRCTGHVVRVEPIESGAGKMGVGVQFHCYEVARTERRREAQDAKLRKRVTMPIAP